MADPADDERARNRWLIINACRIVGVAMVLIGLLIIQAVVELPDAVGYVLVLAGLADVFLVPMLLSRKWRTPEP